MKIGPNDKFWCVEDPDQADLLGGNWELVDIFWEADFKSLMLQFKGGLGPKISLYDNEEEALRDAEAIITSRGKIGKKAQDFKFGEDGFVEIMDSIRKMADNGYGVVDIMLSIGEKFDKAKATAVLEEARERGII